AGALRAALSRKIVTSAELRTGRLLVPEKMTSSMAAARMDLCEVSPMTQRRASRRLEFPQPLGPTTPVSPGSMMSSVGSTKDLKPNRRRRVIFIGYPKVRQRSKALCGRGSAGSAGSRGARCKHWPNHGADLLDREHLLDAGAVDKEVGRA